MAGYINTMVLNTIHFTAGTNLQLIQYYCLNTLIIINQLQNYFKMYSFLIRLLYKKCRIRTTLKEYYQ